MKTEQLSEREKAIYKLLLRGANNLEIGEVICREESTVSGYTRKLFRKLGVCSKRKLLEKVRDEETRIISEIDLALTKVLAEKGHCEELTEIHKKLKSLREEI